MFVFLLSSFADDPVSWLARYASHFTNRGLSFPPSAISHPSFAPLLTGHQLLPSFNQSAEPAHAWRLWEISWRTAVRLGKQGWKARYVKEVDADEVTVRFYQEIYDDTGKLIEIHHKYAIDQGHKKVTS